MTELTTTQQPQQPRNAVTPGYNPFARMQAEHVNAGTVSIESERAIAEAQGKMLLAQRFPRDEGQAFARAMDACKRPTLAATAFYSYPRGGETISGPTIRLAEELARCWGRIEYGIRELSRKDGVSEMQAFAIDLQNQVYSTQNFTVRHIRDTRQGKKDLVDERDIYELTANMGGRRLRARILAVLPPDLKDAAIEMCRSTLAGNSDVPVLDRVRKMTQAFAKLGVTDALLIKRLGHPLDQTTADELADLLGIHNSLKDGVTKADDWFGDNPVSDIDPDADEKPDGGLKNVIADQQKKAAAEAKDKTPDSKPAADKPTDKPRAARKTDKPAAETAQPNDEAPAQQAQAEVEQATPQPEAETQQQAPEHTPAEDGDALF